MENNHHIDRIFRSGVERYELRPSDDVWNRIEQELSQTSAKTHRNIPAARYAALFMLFLTVTLLSTPFGNPSLSLSPVSSPEPALAASEQILNTSAIQAAALTSVPRQLPVQASAIAQFTLEIPSEPQLMETFASITIPPVTDQEEFIFLPPLPEDEEVFAQNQDIFERVYNMAEPIDMMGFSYIGQEPEDQELEVMDAPTYKARYRDMDMRGMYMGVAASYNQVSILEYGNVFKGTRPIQPSLKFGHTKGVKVGYNINNNFGIEAEYVYNAVQGQNYVMSEDDEIVEKSLSLNYDLIPVTAKVKVGRISDLTDKPIVLNYTAGVQYGMLREARMPQDKRYEESAEELFKHNDVSVVLGLEYDVYLQDNLVVSAGARGTFSNDISTHIEPLNDYAKRNFVFGLRAGVSYVFR